MNDLIFFLISIAGYMFIWAAADVHRGPESKIEAFDRYFFLQLFLIIVGMALIDFADHLTEAL